MSINEMAYANYSRRHLKLPHLLFHELNETLREIFIHSDVPTDTLGPVLKIQIPISEYALKPSRGVDSDIYTRAARHQVIIALTIKSGA